MTTATGEVSIDASAAGDDLGGDIFEVMAEHLGAELATGEDEHPGGSDGHRGHGHALGRCELRCSRGHGHALDLGAELMAEPTGGDGGEPGARHLHRAPGTFLFWR